jgi:photosynthetic reaction center cytochrome c subunit
MIRALKTAAALLGLATMLTACERPPMLSSQNGYRGTGMDQVNNPRTVKAAAPLHVSPPPEPPASPDGPKAGQVFQNLQVLGDLSIGELTRQMTAIASWVAPKEGCVYCHNLQNLADDSKYTKQVARQMLKMTQHINVDWKQHVAISGVGVTCFTCHRGNPVPVNTWVSPVSSTGKGDLGWDAGQNKRSEVVGLTSLPYDPFTPYLTSDKAITPIRVYSPNALPTQGISRIGTKQAEQTYALMMHISKALGVNCTFCHATQQFSTWAGPAQRVTAWYGIRMAGELNDTYLKPLTPILPANRLGPTGDVLKINCATCHQGANKPLFGAPLAKEYPALNFVKKLVAQVPVPAPDINGLLGKVLFETGKSELGTDAQEIIKAAVTALTANAGVKVAISGYADQAGTTQANLELAKQRAIVVRDALKAGGVAEARIELKKPELVIGGTESDSRRVEIVAAR